MQVQCSMLPFSDGSEVTNTDSVTESVNFSHIDFISRGAM